MAADSNRRNCFAEQTTVISKLCYGNDLYDSRVRFILTIRASGLFISPGELTLSLYLRAPTSQKIFVIYIQKYTIFRVSSSSVPARKKELMSLLAYLKAVAYQLVFWLRVSVVSTVFRTNFVHSISDSHSFSIFFFFSLYTVSDHCDSLHCF